MKFYNVLLLAFSTSVFLSTDLLAEVKLEYDKAGFVKACLESSDLSRAVCKCTSEKAARELSPTGFEFLVSTLNKDKEKSIELRHKLEQKEVVTAGKFMSHGPALCAKELGGKAAK